MGLMVYAKYGRTGVYQIQDLMKMVNKEARSRAEEVINGKLILGNLPATNWHKRGWELFPNYKNLSEAEVYDTFLHKQDKTYSIPELYKFVENANLNFAKLTLCLVLNIVKMENEAVVAYSHLKALTLFGRPFYLFYLQFF